MTNLELIVCLGKGVSGVKRAYISSVCFGRTTVDRRKAHAILCKALFECTPAPNAIAMLNRNGVIQAALLDRLDWCLKCSHIKIVRRGIT